VLRLQRILGNRHTQGIVDQFAHQSLAQRTPGVMRPDAPYPERTQINITGSYEALQGATDRFTFQINQAGWQFQGSAQRRKPITNMPNRQIIDHYTVRGDFSEDRDGQTIFTYERFNSAGALRSRGQMQFRQDANGETIMQTDDNGELQAFRRISTTPRPAEEAIDALPDDVRDIVDASVNAPLDAQDRERLTSGIEQIKSLIAESTGKSRGEQRGYASRINQAVRTLISDFAPEQKPLVVRRIREALTIETHRHEDFTQSYWHWLEILVREHPDFTADIQSNLDIRPDGMSATPNRYRWMISTAGFSGDAVLGAGGFIGSFIVEKTAPDTWSRSYTLLMLSYSAGLSAGITTGQTTDWSEFETPYDWTPANFPGSFWMAGGTASASAGGGGGRGAGLMTLSGDGSFPPLLVDSSGWFLEIGLHYGAEGGGATGHIFSSNEEAIRHAQQMREIQAQSQYNIRSDIHFVVNDPGLTADGMDTIRQMCATHLLAFQNPQSTLAVDGYTSTTGSTSHNQRLSELRAQNTLQYIRDVIGDQIAIPQDQVRATGHGETAARDAGIADNVEDEAWRKVEVRLNGRVVLTLH
jgi:outer membrane protein OmpA-like peptidoglycan-associated protein